MVFKTEYSCVLRQVFLTNASTAMWGSSEPEGVNVTLDLLQICVITEKIGLIYYIL